MPTALSNQMIPLRRSRFTPSFQVVAIVLVGVFHVDSLPKAEPALPGEPCQVEPRSDWSDIEKWVWDRACHGQIADVNDLGEHSRQTLDPRSPEGWTDDRKLSATFLETLLLHEPYRGALTRRGVRIIGVWFDEPVDLNEGDLPHEIWLVRSRFTREVDLSGATIGSYASFEESAYSEALYMVGAIIDQLDLSHATVSRKLDLGGAKIGDDLSLVGSKVGGRVNMDSAIVSGDLFMHDGAEFAQAVLTGAKIDGQLDLSRATVSSRLDLGGAKIGGQLNLSGAKVSGMLNMDSATVSSNLFMEGGAEFAEVSLGGAKIDGDLSLVGSKVGGRLNMDSAAVTGDLFMRNGAKFAEADLAGAKIDGQLDLSSAKLSGALDLGGARIGGQLNLSGAKVGGTLNMDSATVSSNLFMEGGAEFAEVSLGGAKIDGDLSLVGSKVGGRLNMDSATVTGDLFMRDGAKFAEFDLAGAKINGQLSLSGAEVFGPVYMQAVTVGSHIYMYDSNFEREIDLIFADIRGGLYLAGASLAGLDLTETRIKSEFRLADRGRLPKWTENAKLTLRNTEVGALGDQLDGWPKRYELDGFTFQRLAGTDLAYRGGKWWVSWLNTGAGSQQYNPQIYEQLAKALQDVGLSRAAGDVFYASRERARANSLDEDDWRNWLELSVLKVTTGYGYGIRSFRVLFWVAGLILFGVVVLYITGQHRRPDGTTIGFWYSLEMLLPLVQLRKEHPDIDLEGAARYYFYFHKIMGIVLGSFLIAGLSGLTSG